MLSSFRIFVCSLLLGLCLQIVSASWSIWPISWNLPWTQNIANVNEFHCQRARKIFVQYCKKKDAVSKENASRAFLSCFLNQAGGRTGWDESKDCKNLEEKGSTSITSTHDFLDMLCSEDGSILENSFSWFDGDSDISRSLQTLSNGTHNIFEEGKRIQKLFTAVFDNARQFNSFNGDFVKLKVAFLKVNSSTPRIPDFEIIHDELWIMVQDTVDLFDSHLHTISYFKNSIRNDLKSMEKADKTLEDFKDLSLFWGSYLRRMERLSEDVVHNKEMRTKVLYPWLFKEKGTPVSTNGSSSKTARRQNVLEKISSELRERFRFKPRTVFWVLVHNMELVFKMYIRFAFDGLLKNVLESASFSNRMLLASSLFGHLLTILSVLFKVFFWLTNIGISLCLFLVQLKMPQFSFNTLRKRRRQSGHLESAIIKCVKETLDYESERTGVQAMLQSVCQRELDISISKLRSTEKRMMALSRKMNTLRDRTESLQPRAKEAGD